MNKFTLGDVVLHNNSKAEYEVVDFRVVYGKFYYDLEEVDGDGELNDVIESELININDLNKYDIPYHCYHLVVKDKDGNLIHHYMDVGNEEDWGDIQPCIVGDCDDWENSIGVGNDEDGHKQIVKVIDQEDGSMWIGNNAIKTWYDTCVACFAEKYSS